MTNLRNRRTMREEKKLRQRNNSLFLLPLCTSEDNKEADEEGRHKNKEEAREKKEEGVKDK